MRKIIIFLFLLLFCLDAVAQSEETTSQNWIVKWNATAALDIFSFPTLQFAVERKLGSSFSVQTEAGLQVYDFRNVDSTFVTTQGYKLNAEIRFYPFSYFKKDKTLKRNSDGIYTGLQAFYRKNSYNAEIRYYKNAYDADHPEIATEYTDQFGVNKSAYGWNLAFGYQKQFRKLVIEPYIYLGLMTKGIKNRDREFDEDLGHEPNNGPHDYHTVFDTEASSGTDFNLAVGLRVGYRF